MWDQGETLDIDSVVGRILRLDREAERLTTRRRTVNSEELDTSEGQTVTLLLTA